MAAPDILVLQDLINRIGAAKVAQYFDDANDGSVLVTDPNVESTLRSAEGQMFSIMLKSMGRDAIIILIQNDDFMLEQLSWIACELGSERRPELTDAEGWGAHKVQFQRAITTFKDLSKGQARSQGESQAGSPSTIGGRLQPKPPAATEDQFEFAPSRNLPGGKGGFVLPLLFGIEAMRILMMTVA